MLFILVMKKQSWMLKKHFLSMLKTVVLLFRALFEMELICNIINVCYYSFDQFNAPLLNKIINLFKFFFFKMTW